MGALQAPAVVEVRDPMIRIGRSDSATRFSRISVEDNALPRAGNRYDVPGGGVLYAASTAYTCFAETMSRFRPTPAIRTLLASEPRDDDSRFMVCGGIPQAWRLRRRIFSLGLVDPLPFVDIEAPTTLTYLEEVLSGTLLALDYGADNLDIADVRNKDRRLSRAISTHFYAAQDELGHPLYAGVRYRSRLDSGDCWAIFEGTEVQVLEDQSRPIERDDPDLQRLVDEWGLRPF